jgi:hypothetical protein
LVFSCWHGLGETLVIDTTHGDASTRRRLETRFIIKTESELYGLTYKWRDDQSNADLVPEEGLSEIILASNPAQTWRYPSRSECMTCHTQTAGYALGSNYHQLNWENQLGHLEATFLKPSARILTLFQRSPMPMMKRLQSNGGYVPTFKRIAPNAISLTDPPVVTGMLVSQHLLMLLASSLEYW